MSTNNDPKPEQEIPADLEINVSEDVIAKPVFGPGK